MAAAKKARYFAHNAPGVDEGWVADLPNKYLKAKGGPLKWANFAQSKQQSEEDSDSDDSSDSDDE